MQRMRIVVSGMVQGVGFRAYAQREAGSIGLTGWVRNKMDGTVEILAEGKRETLEKLLAWAHKGPPAGRIGKLTVSFEPATNEFDDFRIRN